MDVLNNVIEILKLSIDKNKEMISNLNVKLVFLNDKIDNINNIDNILDNNLMDIDINYIKNVIKNIDNCLINESEINELDNIKKIYEYLNDPQLPNVGVKKEKLLFIKMFKNKIKDLKKILSNDIKDTNNELDYYRDTNEKINNYISKLNKEWLLKENNNEINILFDFLSEIELNKKVLLDFIYYNIDIKFKNEMRDN